MRPRDAVEEMMLDRLRWKLAWFIAHRQWCMRVDKVLHGAYQARVIDLRLLHHPDARLKYCPDDKWPRWKS